MKERNQICFLTANKGKFREAASVAAPYNVKLRMLPETKIEIQSESLREIASYAAEEAASRLDVVVIAEDAGLFVDGLNGFPGPYSSDFFKRLGTNGILTLMRNVSERSAKFYSAVAYCRPGNEPHCFTGTVAGTISRRERGSGGFGFDSIFVPTRGDGRTFAEMSIEEKNTISHRAASFRKLSRWLSTLQTA